MSKNNHVWSFSAVGGEKRVNLESGADLLHLSELDPKLWTALSCPVEGLEIDRRTLEIIDEDKDGHVRVPEIITAVEWVTSVLKNPDELLKNNVAFNISSINDQTELGKTLLNSAKIILKSFGKEGTELLTVEETSDIERIFAGTKYNGDGVINEDSADDEQVKKIIHEVIQCVGSTPDRGGKKGITEDLVKQFIEHCNNYSDWHAKKEADVATILPFGDNTETAFINYTSLKSKIDDFFIRCRLAAYDRQSTEILNLRTVQVELITSKDLSTCLEDIASFPLAKIDEQAQLPLVAGINPAWEKAIMEFKKLIVDVLFSDKNFITEAEWQTIVYSFKAYEKWKAERKGEEVEVLGLQRIRQILSESYKQELFVLIDKDKALETEANNIISVDKLVRYHRDIFTLLKNFVTFFDFYTPDSKAIFQAGTLYIDQRSCDLCIKVTNKDKHATMAGYSGMFLIYCDCVSKSTNEKMTIVAALTNGDIDNLVVGKNALFYDRKGLDWDATVVKIIDNPISIRQAFFSPYRKVSRFIENQINKVAASQDEKVTADMTKGIENVPLKVEETKAKKEAPAPFDVGKFVGIFAAIGLALGAIGTAITSVVAGFLGLEWWKMPFAIAGLLLLISGPSMVMAYLKLRQRNIAPLLDANGWAINASSVVNIQFGNTLTHLAELPKGAKINLNDPFTKKSRPLLPFILLLSVVAGALLFLLWKYGYLHLAF